jgi:hypothetical protein
MIKVIIFIIITVGKNVFGIVNNLVIVLKAKYIAIINYIVTAIIKNVTILIVDVFINGF